MNIEDYKGLVLSLPVKQQCVTTRRSFWLKGENLEWVKSIHDTMFEDSGVSCISRQDIFDTQDIRALVLKIIYWGTPYGMTWRGSPFLNVLQQIDQLQQLQQIRYQNISIQQYNELKKMFDSIPSMGLTIYSKLLYFLNIQVESLPCLILENKLVNIFSKGIFENFVSLKGMSEYNKKAKYIEYLKIIYDISKSINVEGENIEQFLLIFGTELKLNNVTQ